MLLIGGMVPLMAGILARVGSRKELFDSKLGSIGSSPASPAFATLSLPQGPSSLKALCWTVWALRTMIYNLSLSP